MAPTSEKPSLTPRSRGSIADDEERDALAGMVRAPERRVVAVVCGDDHEVFFGQRVEQLRQPVVEARYVLGHAFRVAAVAVLGVEVDEVGEDEARLDAAQGLQDGVHFGVVVGRGGEVFR